MIIKRIKIVPVLYGVMAFIMLGAGQIAWAGDGNDGPHEATFNDVAANIQISAGELPGLLSAIAFMMAMLMGALGIVKMKEHVESPHNTPLREPMIRFFAGGALMALPMIFGAMQRTISGDGTDFTGSGDAAAGNNDINAILGNILNSLDSTPGFLSAVCYMLALVMGVAAILKIKEHVESPQNTPMREGVVRLLVGGALFSLPVIFSAMQEAITQGFDGNGTTMFSFGEGPDEYAYATCMAAGGGAGGGGNETLGAITCALQTSVSNAPGFLTASAYMFGIFLGVWGLLKLKDHVLNPQQTSVWEPITRLIAGGAFFALPYMIDVVRNSIEGDLSGFVTTAFGGTASGSGLDGLLTRFVGDIYGPLTFIVNWFGYIAGTVLIMVGISRLLKGAQEGPRGPGGIGTIMTFIAGGALLSLSPMISAFSSSLFAAGGGQVAAALQYSTGMSADEIAHVQAVISAILKFMIVIGLVSFVRGIFIVRTVSEGGQASLMSGITHLLGGALAINLGPVMNAVQATLGLTTYGVLFN